MVAKLDQPGRTTERFRPLSSEVGLSLAFREIPLLQLKNAGPKTETEVNYHTGYVQIRSYLLARHVTSPLALEIHTFNNLRNEGQAGKLWRDNIRLSLGKAQFQKHGAGLQWEIIKVPKSVRAILGEGGVGLQVNGYRRIEFSGTSRWESNVQNTGSYRQSKFPSLDMKQVSRFAIKGNIGSKIYVTVDQDSKRESDLANRMQIRYKGDEDDVLQTVELGNTTLNLPNSRFVGYSQQIQGLFGVKATAKLGDLNLTMITSQEKGSTEKTRFTAGAKQNVLYVRDYQYYGRTYYDLWHFGRLGEGLSYTQGDTLIEFHLFGQGIMQENDRFARMYIDPRDTARYRGEYTGSYVREMTSPEDFYLVRDQFWIRLERQLRINDLLACYMVVGTAHGRDTVGTLRGDTLQLRILKPPIFSDQSATWDYEWKNVYYLQAQKLDYDEFQLDILKGAPGSEHDESNKNDQGGVRYLQLFGLDLTGTQGPDPDGRVDRADAILDLYRGHLLFPHRTPFSPGDSTYVPGTRLDPQVPVIYTTSNLGTLTDSSKYYLKITTSRRTNQYSLGRVNILENSETVTFNGRRLVKGADYQIDYELGQITFLNTDVTQDPNADLTIDFEYAPFLTMDKKTLFGSRAEYAPSQNFQIGSSFLYKAQKSTDRQPRLGQEKSRSIIGEMDFSLATSPRWMTKLADAVPLVEVSPSAPSSFRLSGELARSMPDPNTQGKVYLDDFEGTRLSTELGHLREYWTTCSRPEGVSDSARARFIWYNPFYDFNVQDIYDRDIGADRQVTKTKVLVLRLTPDSVGSWGGIMRAITGTNDQSRAQFLEVRLGTWGEVQGNLHVDMGEISEDINGDGNLQDEDREIPGVRAKNGNLDDGEDTGLDMVPDSLEIGRDGRRYDRVTNPDPSGDNSYYSEQDKENYEHINGTEGNAAWDYRGKNPDTEDIDGNDNLDLKNSYYSFKIDLVNSEYRVKGSDWPAPGKSRSGVPIVFRTYRVPLWQQPGDPNAAAVGNPSASLIRYARLWLDGMIEPAEIVIATLDIVENRWQGLPVGDEDTLTTNKHIRAEVINNEENRNYKPPPGVAGYLDRQSQRREKEQSLLVRFENFEKGDTGWAVKSLNQVEDYTGYQFLRMFVHLDTAITRDTGIVSFIFRMGNSANDYYEQRFDLDTGWSLQNEVVFDFDRLTPLKRLGIEVDVGGQTERWSPDSTYRVHGNPTLTQMRYFAVGLTYKEGAKEHLTGEVWCDEMRLTGVRRDQGTAARMSLTADFADLFGVALNSEYQTYSFRGLAGMSSGPGQGANLLNGSTQTRNDVNTRLSLNKFLPNSWKAQLPVSVRYTKDISVPKLETGSDIVLTSGLQEQQTTTNIGYAVTLSESLSPETKNWLARMTVSAFSMSGSLSQQQTWSPQLWRKSESYNASGRYGLNFQNLLPISPLLWTKYLFLPKAIWATQLRLLPKSFQASGSIQRTRDESTNAQGFPIFSFSRRFRGQGDWQFEPFSVLHASYGFSTERDLYDPELIRFSFIPRDFHLGRETKFTQHMDAGYTPPLLSFLSPSLSYSANYNEDSDPKRYLDGTRSAGVSSRMSAGGTVNFKRLLGMKGGGASRSRSTGSEKSKETQKEKEKEADKTKEKDKNKNKGQSKGEGQAKQPATDIEVVDSLKAGEHPAAETGKEKGKAKEKDKSNNQNQDQERDQNKYKVQEQKPPTEATAADSLKAGKPAKPETPPAGSGGFRPQAPFIWILRLVASPFDPIKINYAHDETRSLFRLLARPTFPYRLGLTSTPGATKAATQGTGRESDNETSGDSYGMNSVVSVLGLLKVSTSYDYARSTSLSTTNSRRTARTFPKMSTSLGQLGKGKLVSRLKPLKWVLDNSSAKFDYSRTLEELESLSGADTTTGWGLDSRAVSNRLGASLGFRQSFKNGLKLNAEYNWSLTLDAREQFAINQYSASRQYATAIGFTAGYMLQARSGIRFPLLRGLRLKSTLNLSLAVRLSSNRSESAKDKGGPYTIGQNRTSLEITPQGNYSFSSNMKGGFLMSWRDQTDKAVHPERTSSTRQVSIWLEFTF